MKTRKIEKRLNTVRWKKKLSDAKGKEGKSRTGKLGSIRSGGGKRN
jgi:hypothetical protein